MKRYLFIFLGSMLIMPAFAEGEVTPAITQFISPTRSDPQSGAIAAESAPKYDFNTITATDQGHIASTAYVKGAHNSVISAVNYLEDSKQNQLVNTDSSVVSNVVKTEIGTTGVGGSATDSSMVTELAVATALTGKQPNLLSGDGGNITVNNLTSDAPIVTGITADGTGAVVVNKGEVQIPVGSASAPTNHASIWIQ